MFAAPSLAPAPANGKREAAMPRKLQPRRLRTYRRLKRNYKTARGAWGAISRETGISASRVVSKAHTRTFWVFKVR